MHVEAVEMDADQPILCEVRLRAQEMLERMEAVRNAPLPAEEDIPELTPKQRDRIGAAALRAEIKAMR